MPDAQPFNIISLVPYRILPPTSGGHLGIVDMHHYIGLHCHDNVVSTEDNDAEGKYSFTIHRLFPASPKRYLPRYKLQPIQRLANELHARYIYCDHPYMCFTAIALSKRLGIPWFMRSHNIESERFRTLGKRWWKIMWWFERYAMRHADGVLFITLEDLKCGRDNYRLKPEQCHLAPYGTTLARKPQGHDAAKQQLAEELNLNASMPWLYFLGALNYQPNIEAVQYILNEIAPRLERSGKPYGILLAGKGLSTELQQRIEQTPHVRYMGFIPVLDTFLNACDIMLNPVMTGGGIKTKAVEALGYNKIVVSSAIGAAGLVPEVCGNNLHITPDYDWYAFTNKIIEVMYLKTDIPDSFYNTYNWDKIAIHVLDIMQQATARRRH